MADRSSFAFQSTVYELPEDLEASRELAAESKTTPRVPRPCRGCDGPADETCAECQASICVACDERCGLCDAALCDPCAARHVHVSLPALRVPDPDLGHCQPPAACARRRTCGAHAA
jgi:hypothetical protein